MEQYLLSKIRRIVVRNFSNNNFSYDLRCVRSRMRVFLIDFGNIGNLFCRLRRMFRLL